MPRGVDQLTIKMTGPRPPTARRRPLRQDSAKNEKYSENN